MDLKLGKYSRNVLFLTSKSFSNYSSNGMGETGVGHSAYSEDCMTKFA